VHIHIYHNYNLPVLFASRRIHTMCGVRAR